MTGESDKETFASVSDVDAKVCVKYSIPGASESRRVNFALTWLGISGMLPSAMGWQVCTTGKACDEGRRFCNFFGIDILLSMLF